MFYRFTLAAVVAATTLTGCAAHKSASTTASVSEATQATDAPVAATAPAPPAQVEQSTPAVQSAQTEQPLQPVQTQPITAPGAVTESTAAPVASAEVATDAVATATTDTAADTQVATGTTREPTVADTTAAAAAPIKEEKISAAEGTQAIAPFSSGATQIDVSHIVTRADDGSSITLTIDGTEAGILKRGEKRAVFVEPGKHKVGGYVQTLFGLGRVTIPAVEITTVPGKVKNVSYSVTKTKPAFMEAKDSANAAG